MNALNVIQPYRYLGMWVFDDAAKGLVQEPFVSGADDILDAWAAQFGPETDKMTLVFAEAPFPSAKHQFVWKRAEANGNVYGLEGTEVEGWLCPALLKYFESPPKELYVEVRRAA